MDLEVAYQRCLNCLVWSIEQLGGNAERSQLQPIADTIVQTMTGPWRYFHTPSHIFEVGGSQDPIEVLAALFHDLVYVQVDSGVSLNIGRYISPYIKDEKGQLAILQASYLPPNDAMFELVLAIFGFDPGDALSPFKGQNEFLSAVIAGKALTPFLPTETIARIAACIEATIPFRPHEGDLSPADRLYQRLTVANHRFNLHWKDETIVNAVRQAVRLANRDVENFAFPNAADFLDNTWNLMPETNHELLNANSYTVQGYRRSLQKMEGFINFLKPELVFQRFRGEPDAANFQELVDRTARNLEVGKLYLGTKLVTIAIIEAISTRLGRNIPISTLMGELPTPGMHTPTLAQFIPEIPPAYPPKTALEVEVLDLLSKGRNRESAYDLKNSPVATFIVKSMGFDALRGFLVSAKAFLAGDMSPDEFLAQCDPAIVDAILNGAIRLFECRLEALRGESVDRKVPA